MSTATKLEYLNDTKGLLKDSINSLGGEITSQTTFRQYATELDSIYASLPKVSGSGSNVTLTPTLKGRLGSVINGDTEQNSYSGTQLFNAGAISNTNIIVSDDGKTITMPIISSGNGITSTETLLKILCPTLEVGDVVYLKATTTSQQNTYIYLGASDYLWSFNTSRTITQRDLDSNVNLYGNRYSSGETNQVTIRNFRIVKNSTDTWEKFVGGTASPNPDYPQEIKSVTGLQKVKVQGKNLFDGNYVNSVIGGNVGNQYFSNDNCRTAVIKVQPNTTYTIKKYSNTGIGNRFQIGGDNELLTPSNTSFLDTMYVMDNTLISSTITTNATTNYLYVYVTNDDNNIPYLQLEKGSTATTYEAYQSQEYEINLGTIKLNKIGNYQDYITGTPNNWSIKRQIGSVVLDGSETISGAVSGNYFATYQDITNLKSASSDSVAEDILSNNFIAISRNDWNSASVLEEGIGVSVSRKLLFKILSSRLSNPNINGFKSWLSSNNTQVDYVLATETTEAITNTELISQLNALYNAKSYNGTTNISVEGDLPMILDVSALKGE